MLPSTNSDVNVVLQQNLRKIFDAVVAPRAAQTCSHQSSTLSARPKSQIPNLKSQIVSSHLLRAVCHPPLHFLRPTFFQPLPCSRLGCIPEWQPVKPSREFGHTTELLTAWYEEVC